MKQLATKVTLKRKNKEAYMMIRATFNAIIVKCNKLVQ